MSEKLTVVYNDTCPICAREVSAYRRTTDARGLNITYSGLSDTDLDQYGLSADQAARAFHVVHKGRLISGVPAFALLWAEIPKMRWLAWLVRLPILAPVAQMFYIRILAPPLFVGHKRRERQGKLRHIA